MAFAKEMIKDACPMTKYDERPMDFLLRVHAAVGINNDLSTRHFPEVYSLGKML